MARRSRDRRLRRVIDDARALGEEGRAREAVALLREAIAQHPRDAELRLALAIELGEDDESRRELEQAAALADDDPLVLFRIASALRDADAHGESVRAARRVAELAGEDFVYADDLLHLRGLLARDEGDDAAAEPLLRAAFEAAPGARGHAQWLAGLLIDHDRLDEALDVVQRGLDHRPGDEGLIELRDWLVS